MFYGIFREGIITSGLLWFSRRLWLVKYENIQESLYKKQNVASHAIITIYESRLRLIGAYTIEFWGCAKPSQTRNPQAFQSITLRIISSPPWYVSNYTLQNNFKIESVNQLVEKTLWTISFQTHSNPLISELALDSLPGNLPHGLKWNRCRDSVVDFEL